MTTREKYDDDELLQPHALAVLGDPAGFRHARDRRSRAMDIRARLPVAILGRERHDWGCVMSEPKFDCLYGLKICNPEFAVKISMPKLSWLDVFRYAARDFLFLVSQAFLLALSITCFRFAFGGF